LKRILRHVALEEQAVAFLDEVVAVADASAGAF
jgi:hypothetical protein